MAEKVPSAAILTIGDEVLRGDTLDTNKAFLGGELTRRGVAVDLAATVPDDLETIAAWVRLLADTHHYVLCCGGIGPTPDDLTRAAVAAAFEVEISIDEERLARFERERGLTLNPGQREMWRLPVGCELLWGEGVNAPGFKLENVYVFPGVPAVMQAMWAAVAERFQGRPEHFVRFQSPARESLFAATMQRYAEAHPGVHFGSYPQLKDGGWTVRIAVHGLDAEEVERVAAQFRAELEGLAD